MNQETISRLDSFFTAAPFMKGGGAQSSAIDDAEKALGVPFADDYRLFLGRYGGALVGPYPIYGLTRAEPMDVRLWSVVSVTEHFRKQQWPGVDSSYVVSMDLAGNPIFMDASGKVVSFDHDAGREFAVADDFSAYVKQCLALV